MSDARCRLSPARRSCQSFVFKVAGGFALSLAMSAQAQPAAVPPPGMVMGAYGQSLQSTATAAVMPAVAASSAVVIPTADPVSRFLQDRGMLAQAQSGSSKLLNQVRDGASGMVLSAMNFLGVRYTRGGNSVENGFDCSGFTRHIFEMSVGMVLPHRAEEQARLQSLIPIKQDQLKPGDLVFFNTMKRTFSHVGIYVGEGKFIHAPRVGGAVRVEDMRESYWAKRFTGARRADLKEQLTPGG
jgi:cell wall-associated NlpC family hydrolase